MTPLKLKRQITARITVWEKDIVDRCTRKLCKALCTAVVPTQITVLTLLLDHFCEAPRLLERNSW